MDTQYSASTAAAGADGAGPTGAIVAVCNPVDSTSTATLTAYASPNVTRWQRLVVSTPSGSLTLDDYRPAGTTAPTTTVDLASASKPGCVVCVSASIPGRAGPVAVHGGQVEIGRATAVGAMVQVTVRGLVADGWCLPGTAVASAAAEEFPCDVLGVPASADGCFSNPHTQEDAAVHCTPGQGTALLHDCVMAGKACQVTGGGTATCSGR